MSIKVDTTNYLKLNEHTVSYSLELDDAVLADYDESGILVGIEFLDESMYRQKEKYIAMAHKMPKGRKNVPKPPEI